MTENMAARGEGLAERILAMDAKLDDGQAIVEWDDLVAEARAALATPSPQAPPILLQDFNAKSGFGVFVVTGEHQRTAFFTRAAAEQYLAQQDPERFRIVMYPKPPAATQEQPAGSTQVVEDLQIALRIVGDWKEDSRGLVHVHKDAIRKAIVAALRSAGNCGSPRKVGEDGDIIECALRNAITKMEGWDSEMFEAEIAECKAALEALSRSSSVPVGEQKQEEGV